jgi:hypothetical protein
VGAHVVHMVVERRRFLTIAAIWVFPGPITLGIPVWLGIRVKDFLGDVRESQEETAWGQLWNDISGVRYAVVRRSVRQPVRKIFIAHTRRTVGVEPLRFVSFREQLGRAVHGHCTAEAVSIDADGRCGVLRLQCYDAVDGQLVNLLPRSVEACMHEALVAAWVVNSNGVQVADPVDRVVGAPKRDNHGVGLRIEAPEPSGSFVVMDSNVRERGRADSL